MTTETQYYISGMKCDGCVSTAIDAISQVDGVDSADVDLSQEVATVFGNVDPQAVCLALAEAGYPAVVKS